MSLKEEEQQSLQQRHQLLDDIEQKVKGSDGKVLSLDGAIFTLATEIGSLGDMIGREYDIIRDKDGKVTKIIQQPMRVKQIITLMDESAAYSERQKQAVNKGTPKKRFG